MRLGGVCTLRVRRVRLREGARPFLGPEMALRGVAIVAASFPGEYEHIHNAENGWSRAGPLDT